MQKWIATHEKFGIREIASLFIINPNQVQFIFVRVCVAIILVKVNLKNLKITLSYLSFAFKRISCNRIFGIFELAIITLNEMHNYCTGCNAES